VQGRSSIAIPAGNPYVIDPDGLGSLDSVLDILELRWR